MTHDLLLPIEFVGCQQARGGDDCRRGDQVVDVIDAVVASPEPTCELSGYPGHILRRSRPGEGRAEILKAVRVNRSTPSAASSGPALLPSYAVNFRGGFPASVNSARVSAKLNFLFMAGACLLVIVIVVARPLRRGRGDVNRGRRFSSPFCTRPRRRVRRIPHACNRSRSTATCARRVH
jgi:hypothetical protein